MSNDITTNNFEELTFRSLLDKYDKILIPMIQRDYAQGRNDKKAQEVRTNLLNDIFEKESVHFDLIFGSCEKRKENDGEKLYFIPVDGQQRLTTLFLLYLYAQKTCRYKDGLDMSKFSYDTRRAAADFCKKVAAEQWGVSNGNVSDAIKDSVWFMNYWENDPTVAGMLNMLDAIHKKANAEGTVFPNLDKVRFYFFDLETSGLNENLYLKMNSRGKPLTAFENLKASIEKMLPNNSEIDDAPKCFPKNDDAPKSFKEKWKFYMDRDWTNAFWDKEHPENTDKNITAFIVRFLSGYYNAFSNSNEANEVADKLKEINNNNNYADFIPFEPIRESLKLGYAFQRLAHAFTTIVNTEEIKPKWNETIKTTDLHEYKIIAVVFAYVLFDGNTQAMRVAWNLAENTVTGYDNFIAYCKRIREILSYHEDNKDDIYQILATKEFKNPSAQLTEEIAKAKQIRNNDCDCVTNKCFGESWEDVINKAETYAFFKGAIRFLFQDENGEVNWCYFEKKWQTAKKLFNAGKENQNTVVLAKYCSEDEVKKIWRKINFDKEDRTWKTLLLLGELNKQVHYLLTQKKELVPNLVQDIENLTCKIPCSLWLRDWWTYEIYLTNYDKRRENPNNGYVYMVGNRLWNASIKKMSGIEGLDLCFEDGKAESDYYECGDFRYYRGRWVKIKYGTNYFRLCDNNIVYLMEEDWTDYKKRPDSQEKDTDEIKYYCFRVDEKMTSESFICELNCLISQANN